MIVIPNRLVFVHVPKAAGTSISKFLLHSKSLLQQGAVDIGALHKTDKRYGGHIPRDQMEELYPEWMTTLPVFAVCRHPYDRLLSGFLHWVRDRGYANGDYPEGFNFEYWVKNMGWKVDKDFPHAWTLPMTTWIREGDIVLRYENLTDDIHKMEKVLDKNMILDARHNLGIKKLLGIDYLKNDIISADLKKYIQEKYKDDFERFGYEG